MIDIPRTIKLLSWIVNAVFWVLIIVISVILLSQLLMLFGMNIDFLSKFTIPVRQNNIALDSILINGLTVPVEASKVIVTVELDNMSGLFQLIFIVNILLTGVLLVYIVGRFRKLLKNVSKNIVFDQANVIFLKQGANAIFLFWILHDVLQDVYYQWYFGSLSHFTIKFPTMIFTNSFILGIVILAIAFIFERGVKLQQEQNLTI